MSKTKNNLFLDLNACNKYYIDEATLKKVGNSFLIISGMLDVMTPLKSSYFLNSMLKNSHLDIIKNCGHFHLHERPGEVRKLINRYIES